MKCSRELFIKVSRNAGSSFEVLGPLRLDGDSTADLDDGVAGCMLRRYLLN
jgi:hypothetical protein